MNKRNPNQIRSEFAQEADELVNFYNDALAGLVGTTHQKRNTTRLAELVFLNAYVAFETFLSDLFIAYVNRNSINFQNSKESQIRKLVKAEFGSWYSNRISLTKVKHLKVDEVKDLVDPDGFNVTFPHTDQMKRIAGAWLSQTFRRKLFTLTSDDFAFIDCCREIRNAIAHKSQRALGLMNTHIRAIPTPSTIDFLHRAAHDVRVPGAFLKSRHQPPSDSRVVLCAQRLKDISSRL